MSRLKNIHDRVAILAKITDGNATEPRLKNEIPHLKHRAVLLNTAIRLALGAGICITLLLMTSFVSAFFRLQHIYGGVLLFVCANGLLTMSLYKFAQEVKSELSEIRQF
jgi:hypothetical protein